MSVRVSRRKFIKRAELLQAQAANNPTGDWLATTAQGTTVVMRPFMSIDDESYSTYVCFLKVKRGIVSVRRLARCCSPADA
jgi:TfoX/Sxy family transcriptional regulator of competence genes